MAPYEFLAYFIMLPHVVVTLLAFSVVFLLGYNESIVFYKLLHRLVPIYLINSMVLLSEVLAYVMLKIF